jgi:hypothetical protein
MKFKEKYSYILRVTILPNWHEEERTQELIRFCKEAEISEVMIFINAEEMNTGHVTQQELDSWMITLKHIFESLTANGIKASINLWETLLHADRGRKLKDGQEWTNMVGADGIKAAAVVCPFDLDWQNHYIGVCRRLATLNPNVIWIEDDFRLHNHRPVDWGCFCEKHMQEFSKKLGYEIDRESFVKELIAPGKPTPVRDVWLDTARKVFVDLAKKIGDAISDVSPQTKVGLMSSGPQWHCAEGRDWNGILGGLAAKNNPVSRPHLPAYENTSPQTYLWNFHQYSTLTAHLLPQNTLIFPELENFPYSPYTKSHNFTRFQIESSIVLPSDGMTLNIFDFTGNGVMKRFGFEKTLIKIKPYLDATYNLNLKKAKRKGVIIPISPDASYNLQTKYGIYMSELMPQETFWASQLSAYGIANTYETLPDCKGEVIAISGQYFRNLSETAVRDLFEFNKIILDGSALETLYDLGLGELAGVTELLNDFWTEDGKTCIEQVVDNKIYAGIEQARISLQGYNFRFIGAKYLSQAEVRSVAMNYNNEIVGNCVAVYKNVCIFPFDVQCARNNHLMTNSREDMIKTIINEMVENNIAMTDCPCLTPYHYDTPEQQILVLINFLDDAYHSPVISGLKWNDNPIYTIDRQSGETLQIEVSRQGENIVLPNIEPMTTCVIWQKK